MTIDIRNDIPHEIAITCLLEVIKMGREYQITTKCTAIRHYSIHLVG